MPNAPYSSRCNQFEKNGTVLDKLSSYIFNL